jgi:hypothetical protein
MRYIIEGLAVAIAAYLIANNKLRLIEIILISLTAVFIVIFLDNYKFSFENFASFSSTNQLLPPGGIRMNPSLNELPTDPQMIPKCVNFNDRVHVLKSNGSDSYERLAD